MKDFDQNDLITAIHNQTGHDKKTIAEIVSALFEQSAIGAATHGKVEYKQFGVIDLVTRQGKKGVAFGKPFNKPNHFKFIFKPSPKFLEIANKNKNPNFPDLVITK
jgi:nucleoid DNA-binding protein